MRVTVVMPMKNAAGYVSAAVDSVLTSAADFDGELEIIVVDDGSNDESTAIVAAMNRRPVRLIGNEGSGIAHALNTGITAATGDVMMRCDADDLYEPGRIASQVRSLTKHSEYVAVCGGFSAIDSAGRLVKRFKCGDEEVDITAELLQGKARTSLCTFAIRTDALRRAGACRAWFETAEDLDLQFRIGGMGSVLYRPGNTYLYRLHNSSTVHTQPTTRREAYAAMASRFAEQRLKTGVDDLMLGVLPPVPEGSASYTGDQHIADLLLGDAWSLVEQGEQWKALRQAFRSCSHDPAKLSRWRHIAVVALRGAISAIKVR